MYPAAIRRYTILLKTFLLENRKVLVNVFLFILITFALHKLWWSWIWSSESFSFLHNWASILAGWVFLISSWMLENIFLISHDTTGNTLLFPGGYIAVLNSCSGLKQFYQLFFLLLLFPGPFKHKLWYIPAGLLLIFMLNIFRIIMLAFVLLWYPDVWDFVHLWILRPFYYVVIFLLWMIWVEKFRL